MVAKAFATALAAAALVSAQTTNKCSQPTITINSNADALNLATCTTLNGNVVIGNDTDNTINIDGPRSITGDLTMLNNGKIVTLSSSSIQTIGGAFHLQNITLLSNLGFSTLRSVKEIHWQSLPQLEQLSFGSTGVTSVTNVVISDTYLNTLSGLDINTVVSMNINNNRRLVTFTSSLTTVNSSLEVTANGNNLQIDMPALTDAANLTFNGIKSFTAPLLANCGSLRFDSNTMTAFTAPNLTQTGGDVSFVDNAALTNLSMPLLKTIGGGLTIANNTALEKIDGLPKMETVGAVKLRGNFTQVSLPSLRNAKGAFDVQSTKDISSSCAIFSPMQANQGGQIQGTYNCDSNEQNANQDNSTGGGGSSGGGSGGGSGSSAASQTANFAVLGLALVGGLAASFL